MLMFLCTKFAHWKYEEEFRLFFALDHSTAKDGLYFADFSRDLVLTQVIVGANSSVCRKDVYDALGQQQASIESFKARLAFKSFSVVRNMKQCLWV